MSDTNSTLLENVTSRMTEMRGLNNHKPAHEFSSDRFAFQPVPVFLAPGIVLDPKRGVSKKWKRTSHTDKLIVINPSKDSREQVDAGYGWGVSVNVGGPFKVRHLHHPTIGKVEELSAIEYELARGAASFGGTPKFEPVPDDVPECPPILPPGFPSFFEKAKKIAAAGLKKSADELSAAEVIKYFKTRKEVVEVIS